MHPHQHNPSLDTDTSPIEPTIFGDLRARNERQRASRQLKAERQRRIERVRETTRYWARLAERSRRHPRPGSDRF